jgi:Arc/MetJ-type ribon-helix-helix transcriptional regulator
MTLPFEVTVSKSVRYNIDAVAGAEALVSKGRYRDFSEVARTAMDFFLGHIEATSPKPDTEELVGIPDYNALRRRVVLLGVASAHAQQKGEDIVDAYVSKFRSDDGSLPEEARAELSADVHSMGLAYRLVVKARADKLDGTKPAVLDRLSPANLRTGLIAHKMYELVATDAEVEKIAERVHDLLGDHRIDQFISAELRGASE